MALYKPVKWQVGYKFNQPAKASAAYSHISPINMMSRLDYLSDARLGSDMHNSRLMHRPYRPEILALS